MDQIDIKEQIDDSWILNSVSSYHICSNKDFIVIHRHWRCRTVTTVTNVDSKIGYEETNKLRWFMLQYANCQMSSMFPDLKKNIVSLSTLDSKNCWYSADKGLQRIL